mmetsp:Transcript_103549/g.319455  ORF Transcript_103549/g.319455 Transcript_103549/m.319455 type:complete len:179 (-) Transcript_103549:9-545(-)
MLILNTASMGSFTAGAAVCCEAFRDSPSTEPLRGRGVVAAAAENLAPPEGSLEALALALLWALVVFGEEPAFRRGLWGWAAVGAAFGAGGWRLARDPDLGEVVREAGVRLGCSLAASELFLAADPVEVDPLRGVGVAADLFGPGVLMLLVEPTAFRISRRRLWPHGGGVPPGGRGAWT